MFGIAPDFDGRFMTFSAGIRIDDFACDVAGFCDFENFVCSTFGEILHRFVPQVEQPAITPIEFTSCVNLGHPSTGTNPLGGHRSAQAAAFNIGGRPTLGKTGG